MANFLATLGSYYGVIAITDSNTDPNRTTATYQINDHCIAVVFRGINGVKKFIDTHVVPIKDNNIEQLIQKTINAFDQHHKDYANDCFSFFLASYVDGKPIYHIFWFDKKGTHYNARLDRIVQFIDVIEDLSAYITLKVYSEHMSLEELKNLGVFIALQCVKILNYNFNFDVTLISSTGIKKLSVGEIKDIFSKQERVDTELRKLFSDFFVNEVKQK